MAETITMAGVTSALAELEKAFPRKTTAASFRMNGETARVLQAFLPAAKTNPLLPPGMITGGVRVVIDNELPNLAVQVINLDGEVIQVIDMGRR